MRQIAQERRLTGVSGYTNSSLYTGSIDYINIPGTPSFWYLPLECETCLF